MKDAIKAYSDAFTAHQEAMRAETSAKIRVVITRQALLKAKEELRATEVELIYEAEREISNKK